MTVLQQTNGGLTIHAYGNKYYINAKTGAVETTRAAGQAVPGDHTGALLGFAVACLTFGTGQRCHVSDVWAAYLAYCLLTSSDVLGKQQFNAELRRCLTATGAEYKTALRLNKLNKAGYTGMGIKP
jgi:hypothetical protein